MTRSTGRAAWFWAAFAVSAAPAALLAQETTGEKPAPQAPAQKPRPASAGKPATPPQAAKPAAASVTSASATSPAAARPRLLATHSRRRGFRTSIDDYVEQVFQSHQDPCAKAAREGVPCFPVSIDQEGPRFSVADAMRRYRVEGGPAPNQLPTNAELHQQMSGAPLSASGGVSLDPGCTVKSLIRQIRGGTNTFYLYRTWNGDEERPLLTDHKLDPNTFQRVPGFRYEFVGEYKGECEAVAAWRSAERNPRPPAAAGEGQAPPAEGATPP